MRGKESERDAIGIRQFPWKLFVVISFHHDRHLSTGRESSLCVRIPRNKKWSFYGIIAETTGGGAIEFALAFRPTFCYQVNPIDIEGEILPLLATRTEHHK